MVKTVVTPQNNSLYLVIPNNYIGKEIEVLFYAKDELEEEKMKPKKTMADFCGVISDETAKKMHKELKKTRDDWEKRLKKQV